MTQLMAIAEEYLDPIRYKLILKSPDESETIHTYDSFHLDNPPFALTNIDVNLGAGVTGDFSFLINDTKDRVVSDTIDCGTIAYIQAGKKEGEYKTIMWGIIDEIEDSYPVGDKLLYSVRGLGGGVILNYTLLNMVMSANKEDLVGETLHNDVNFRIGNLVTKAFESSDVLPVRNSPTLKVRGGFLLDSMIKAIKVVMPAINNPQATASTILENFAATSGTVLHIDPNKTVFFRPPYVKHSGITLRQWEVDPVTNLPTRLNDSAATTAYYFGGWSSKKTMKAGEFFNRIFLTINTDEVISQASGEETENFTSLANKDIGVQFPPSSTKIFNIALLLSKTGTGRSSVEDAFDMKGVNGIICEDSGNNQPSGKVIATFTIPYDDIDTGPTVVYKIDLQYRVANIDQNKLHWILLFKTGENEDNTVRWFHDSDFVTNSTTKTPRFSAMKRPYTKQPNPIKESFSSGWGTSSKGPVYRYSFFLTNRTTIVADDPISIAKYTPNRPIEIRINAPWIQDVRTGFRYANTLLSYGAKLKKIYEKKQVSIPTRMFFPLRLINIIYPPAGITANTNTIAEINNVHYSGNAFDEGSPFGSYFCELTAVGYVNHNQKNLGDALVCGN